MLIYFEDPTDSRSLSNAVGLVYSWTLIFAIDAIDDVV